MGRGVGFLMYIVLEGLAKDIETIARLRPWMEFKMREEHGDLGESKLITDYDQNKNIFKFKIIFTNES
jgi:hypothetical protein